MNFKRYHVSKNLFDGQLQQGYYTYFNGVYVLSDAYVCTHLIPCTENTTYTFRCINTGGGSKNYGYVFFDSSQNRIGDDYIDRLTEEDVVTHTATTPQNTAFLAINIAYGRRQANVIRPSDITDFMLNTGSNPLPYEPYSSEVWHDIPHYIMNTSTDTITTLPAVLYPNDTTATVGLKGNMEQNGTPSPQNPIQPSECGDLETTGEHAGQYKIPISSASTTTPVYLGEVESTRKIAKYEFTGEESGTIYSTATSRKGIEITGITGIIGGNADIAILAICTHYQPNTRTALYRNTDNGISNAYQNDRIIFYDASCQTVEAFQQFCAQQYATGTPVTVWYVLPTETTGIVNEPIRKIGDYADTVSGITIPTIAGENSFDVLTTLKPSEVTVNYKGWHTGAVHECDSGQWD